MGFTTILAIASVGMQAIGASKAAKAQKSVSQANAAQAAENARIAKEERIPMCQDCGLAVVFAEVGQDVHLVGGDFDQAINAGIREAIHPIICQIDQDVILQPGWLAQVLEHLVCVHDVERRVVVVERVHVAHGERDQGVVGGREVARRGRDDVVGHVDAQHLAGEHPPGEVGADRARAAADVEQRPERRKRTREAGEQACRRRGMTAMSAPAVFS